MTTFAVLSHRDVAAELGHIGTWLESRDARVSRFFREDPLELPDADALIVLGDVVTVVLPPNGGCCYQTANRRISTITYEAHL
ncbi:MAG: hypothetical protein FJW18_10065 [Actinobacteria bacterium]|nr:hypothetical protein [Actinomycetota bacterium]